jgi:hypothetical protein
LLITNSPQGRCERLKNAKDSVWTSDLNRSQILWPGCPGHHIGILHPLTKERVSSAVQSQFHPIILIVPFVAEIVIDYNGTEAGIPFDSPDNTTLHIIREEVAKVQYKIVRMHLWDARDPQFSLESMGPREKCFKGLVSTAAMSRLKFPDVSNP